MRLLGKRAQHAKRVKKHKARFITAVCIIIVPFLGVATSASSSLHSRLRMRQAGNNSRMNSNMNVVSRPRRTTTRQSSSTTYKADAHPVRQKRFQPRSAIRKGTTFAIPSTKPSRTRAVRKLPQSASESQNTLTQIGFLPHVGGADTPEEDSELELQDVEMRDSEAETNSAASQDLENQEPEQLTSSKRRRTDPRTDPRTSHRTDSQRTLTQNHGLGWIKILDSEEGSDNEELIDSDAPTVHEDTDICMDADIAHEPEHLEPDTEDNELEDFDAENQAPSPPPTQSIEAPDPLPTANLTPPHSIKQEIPSSTSPASTAFFTPARQPLAELPENLVPTHDSPRRRLDFGSKKRLQSLAADEHEKENFDSSPAAPKHVKHEDESQQPLCSPVATRAVAAASPYITSHALPSPSPFKTPSVPASRALPDVSPSPKPRARPVPFIPAAPSSSASSKRKRSDGDRDLKEAGVEAERHAVPSSQASTADLSQPSTPDPPRTQDMPATVSSPPPPPLMLEQSQVQVPSSLSPAESPGVVPFSSSQTSGYGRDVGERRRDRDMSPLHSIYTERDVVRASQLLEEDTFVLD